MPKRFTPIALGGLKTYPLSDRRSTVRMSDFSKAWQKGAGFQHFIDTLPDILAGRDLRKVISSMAEAVRTGRTVLMGMGAHVIKVGLNPIVVDLMERGVLSAVAMNGAGIIHDAELALTGKTSEDVSASLKDGTFGMAQETAAFLSGAITAAEARCLGLGAAVGRAIEQGSLPFRNLSILAAGSRLNIPVTVHVAFGTDILHMHPGFDPRKTGAATHLDFRILASVVGTLQHGVYLNVGSAVILPEVFLKAVSLVRNLGHRLDHFTSVNMDFIQHYRPRTNVVARPTAMGGEGICLTGHHEIMLPVIAAGVIEQIDG